MSDDNIELDFLDEEETYLEQLFFDLDFDPKFSDYIKKEETIEDILNDICSEIDQNYENYENDENDKIDT